MSNPQHPVSDLVERLISYSHGVNPTAQQLVIEAVICIEAATSEAAARISQLEAERDEAREGLLEGDPDWLTRGKTPCAYPRCGCEPDAICHVAIDAAALAATEKDRDHWKANHASVMASKRKQQAFKDEFYTRLQTAEAKVSHLEADLKAAGGGWRDISTAPKDGTVILVWLNAPSTFRGSVVVPAFWCDEEDGLVTTHPFHKRIWTGTHWMPLPQSPTLHGDEDHA